MLYFFAVVGASFAVELVGEVTFEGIFDDIVAIAQLQELFNLLHEGVEELVCVALHHWIDGLSLVVDERITELLCCDAPPAAVLQQAEDLLQLIDLVLLRLLAILQACNRQEMLTEMANVEELLHKAIQVASGAKIL